MSFTLRQMSGEYAVWQLPAGSPLPREPEAAAGGERLWSVTRTQGEVSVVSPADAVPAGARAELGWRALAVAGPLAFSLTGVIAGITAPLAAAGVSVFVISTYDTDYLLVKQASLEATRDLLRAAGHQVV